MVTWVMLKNLRSGGVAPSRLLDHLHRVRALDLEAIGLAVAVRAQRGALVALDLDVIAAGGGVKLDPFDDRGPADQVELVRAR